MLECGKHIRNIRNAELKCSFHIKPKSRTKERTRIETQKKARPRTKHMNNNDSYNYCMEYQINLKCAIMMLNRLSLWSFGQSPLFPNVFPSYCFYQSCYLDGTCARVATILHGFFSSSFVSDLFRFVNVLACEVAYSFFNAFAPLLSFHSGECLNTRLVQTISKINRFSVLISFFVFFPQCVLPLPPYIHNLELLLFFLVFVSTLIIIAF